MKTSSDTLHFDKNEELTPRDWVLSLTPLWAFFLMLVLTPLIEKSHTIKDVLVTVEQKEHHLRIMDDGSVRVLDAGLFDETLFTSNGVVMMKKKIWAPRRPVLVFTTPADQYHQQLFATATSS